MEKSLTKPTYILYIGNISVEHDVILGHLISLADARHLLEKLQHIHLIRLLDLAVQLAIPHLYSVIPGRYRRVQSPQMKVTLLQTLLRVVRNELVIQPAILFRSNKTLMLLIEAHGAFKRLVSIIQALFNIDLIA